MSSSLSVKKNYSVTRSGAQKEYEVIVPAADIPLRQIYDQIPNKYFKRIMWKGFAYVARDIVQSLVAAYCMYTIGYAAIAFVDDKLNSMVASFMVRFVMWNIFWFVQGLNWTGLWVLAHECGHQAFSNYRVVNDTVGFFLHSFLLVPYHSWRITHGNHHKHTNHLTKDTVFVPGVHDASLKEIVSESPLVSLFYIIVMLTLGWPGYLLMNVSGQKYSRRANHFEPSSPLFQRDDAPNIVVSDIGVVGMLILLAAASYVFGPVNIAVWYVVPYLWVNAWLVLITYLQHSDIRVPHYTPEQWTFVRGALSTVDRDFGSPINAWLHHINDSHVVHHLFSQMPFYHAIEVTRHHCKDIFGDLYQFSDKSIPGALWESWRECRYVVPSDGAMVFRK